MLASAGMRAVLIIITFALSFGQLASAFQNDGQSKPQAIGATGTQAVRCDRDTSCRAATGWHIAA